MDYHENKKLLPKRELPNLLVAKRIVLKSSSKSKITLQPY